MPDSTVEILYDLSLGIGVPVCLSPLVEISNDGGYRYFAAETTGDHGCCFPNATGSMPACNARMRDRRLVWDPRTNPLPFDRQRTGFESARVRFTDDVTCISFCSNFFVMDVTQYVPTVTLIAPAASSTVSGMVTLIADVELRGGLLAKLEYFVDGAAVGACPPGAACSVTWDATPASPGVHTIVATATNTTGQSGSSTPVRVYTKLPTIESIDPEYPGFFLKNTSVTNAFQATVDWQGHRPGSVSFRVDGGSTFQEPADEDGAAHDFDMASDFVPGHQPSVLTLRAKSADGVEGPEGTANVWVFDYPAWLGDALSRGGAFRIDIGEDAVIYALEADYPVPHLAEDGPIDLPSSIPFIGGKFGLTETYARLRGAVSSRGNGSVTLSGKTGFVAAGNKVEGLVSGGGELRLTPPKGLTLTGATFGMTLAGVIEKEVGVTEAIPRLRDMETLPLIGGAIRIFNRASLRGAISPTLGFEAAFAQSDRTSQLEFREGTGTLGLELEAELQWKLSDRIEAELQAAGGGSLTLGVPERHGHFARSLDLSLQAGAKFKMDFFTASASATYTVSCDWGAGGATCDSGALDSATQLLGAVQDAKLEPLPVDYARFGEYSRLAADGANAVVANIFANARPRLVELDTGPMLLWVHQQTALPLLQSTDIMWSRFDGTAWSAPAVLQQDTRAELSPVAGTDRMGRVVAVWLRMKEPAFALPVETVADLPRFYTQLEVVSAVFDPTANRWGAVTPLTDDLSFDTDLRLSRDDAGHLMLTWIADETTLRCSFWNGARWSVPVAIATGISGLSGHAAALHGGSAFVVVSREEEAGDAVLELFTWNGTAWSGAARLASGCGDHRFPAAVYDASGQAHVLWLCGSDLVHATPASPTPRTVRTAANFRDFALVPGPAGNLILLWRDRTPAGDVTLHGNIFDRGSMLLGSGTSSIHDLDAVYSGNGKVRLAYVSTEVVRREQVVTVNGREVTIPNVPGDGASDLHVAEHALLADLSVRDEELTFDPPKPERGRQAVVTIDVHNAGSLATPAFTVALYAGRPGGEWLGTVVTDGLGSGEHRPVSLHFVHPGKQPLFVVVDAVNGVPEYDESNNVATNAAGRRRAVRHP